MRPFSIAAAFALAMAGAGAVASDQAVPLQLTVFPCAADSAVAPTLSPWAMQRPPSKIPVTPDWQRVGPVWKGSLTLAPGAYMLIIEFAPLQRRSLAVGGDPRRAAPPRPHHQ